LRVRTLSSFLGSLTILAIAATPALGATTGGAAAEAPSTASGTTTATTPLTPKPAIHLSPITAKSRSLAYKGPIYEKTATGEVVPYVPTAPVAPAAALTSTTGGSSTATAAAAAPAPVTSEGVTEVTETAATPQPELLVPGSIARYVNGYAAAPMNAPAAVQQVIWTANAIIGLPYIYGGGHASFNSPGYDCSGTVSYALHGGGLLTTPMDSSELEAWGSHGAGRWIAVFGNAGHAYMDVAGLRLDTSAADDPSDQQGPRWRPLRPENAGYVVRHPLGL
jgi:cell wall-associated NlpC family hydrolase